MGKTDTGCLPLPDNATAAEAAMWQCAERTVSFTEAVLLATTAALIGATVAVVAFQWLVHRR